MQYFRSIAQHSGLASGIEKGQHGQARVPTAADADDIDMLGSFQNTSGFLQGRSPVAQSVVQRSQQLGGFLQNILVELCHLPSFTVSIVLGSINSWSCPRIRPREPRLLNAQR